MATRACVRFTVVSSATTSNSPLQRTVWSAQAPSFPLLHASHALGPAASSNCGRFAVTFPLVRLLAGSTQMPSPKITGSLSIDLRHWSFVNDHPRRSELVSQHAEAQRKKRLLHRHEDLAALGEQSVNALRLLRGVDRHGKIHAAHRLKS